MSNFLSGMKAPEVAILGGGPVGVSASIQLSRWGIPHVLFERNRVPTQHPKSRAINVRTMEIFREWGIHDAVRAAGMQRPPLRFFGRDLASPWDHVMDSTNQYGELDDGRYSPLTLLVKLCSQDALEPILRDHALASPHADLRFGWKVNDWRESDRGVVLEATEIDSDRSCKVEARYLIACDGARSKVRKRLGISCEGEDGIQEAVSVLFRSQTLAQRLGTYSAFVNINNPETIGNAVIAPVDDEGRAALLGRPKVMDEQPFDMIDWQRQLHLALGDPQAEIDLIDTRTWQVAVQIAQTYRAGPIFLAGDAAHLMSPNGGFNMNTGIQDIHNLCWKLAGVLRGWASPDLLDTYTSERRPVAEFNASEAVLNFESHNTSDTAGNSSFYRREHFIHPGLSLGFRYNDGALVPEPGQSPNARWTAGEYHPNAIPGARAPHIWLERAGERISAIDLFGSAFVIFGRADNPAVADVLAAAESRGIPARAYTVGTGGDYAVSEQDWGTLYGTYSLVVIRPDGHVGLRHAELSPPTAQEIDAWWDRLTGRKTPSARHDRHPSHMSAAG